MLERLTRDGHFQAGTPGLCMAIAVRKVARAKDSFMWSSEPRRLVSGQAGPDHQRTR